MASGEETSVRIGPATFVPHERALTTPDGAIRTLRHKTAGVLCLLVEHRGQTVSKDQFFGAVWADTIIDEDGLVQCIAEIRRALGKDHRHLIRTVPKTGYRLEDAAPDRRGPPRFPRRVALTLGLGAGAVGGALLWRTGLRGAAPAGPDPFLPAVPQRIVVIRPFEARSDDPRWKRIGYGLAQDIGAALARDAEIRVILPPSDLPAADLAHWHDRADAVLSGSVHSDRGRVRVSLLLSDPGRGDVVWSDVWEASDRTFYDLHADVVSQAGSAIASTWTSTLAERERLAAAARSPATLDAYDLYLLGSHHKHGFTDEGFRRARALLAGAVRLDPNFGRGWVSLYYLNHLQSMQMPTRTERQEFHERSLVAIDRAAAVAPDDPMTLVVQSVRPALAGDMRSAAAMIRRAVDRAPSNADLLALAAIAGAKHCDLVDEPGAWSARAIGLNPYAPPYHAHSSGFAAIARGDAEGAWNGFGGGVVPSAVIAMAGAAAGHRAERGRIAEIRRRFETHAPPGITVAELMDLQTATAAPFREWVLEGAILAGLPAHPQIRAVAN